MTAGDLQEYIKPVWGDSPATTSFKQSIRQVLEERDALLARVEAGRKMTAKQGLDECLTAAAIMALYRGDGGWCGMEAAKEQARVTIRAYLAALTPNKETQDDC